MRGVVIILICGFMGAGKTTFLNELKTSSNSDQFSDLDEEIFQREGSNFRDLAQLIESLGWEKFRSLELKILADLKIESENSTSDLFISLGGGAVSEKLLELNNSWEQCFLVWLNTPLETCLERIKDDPTRPLTSKGPKYLKELYEQREKYYQRADICLDASSQDMVWTAKTVKERLLS
jgi:shikimate kinase